MKPLPPVTNTFMEEINDKELQKLLQQFERLKDHPLSKYLGWLIIHGVVRRAASFLRFFPFLMARVAIQSSADLPLERDL
jgi:hypothetical protein